MEPAWEGGNIVYINGPGHKTKMAAMPIPGKNLQVSVYRTIGPLVHIRPSKLDIILQKRFL